MRWASIFLQDDPMGTGSTQLVERVTVLPGRKDGNATVLRA